MAVELLLLEDVQDLGQLGDTVRVAEGYARNYLIPQKLATKVTRSALAQLEKKKIKRREEYEQNLAAAQMLAEELSQASVSIPVQATEDDKLYGSVTNIQIAEALEEMDIHIDRKQIALPDAIRELGVYNVDIHLHPEATATLKVWVVKS